MINAIPVLFIIQGDNKQTDFVNSLNDYYHKYGDKNFHLVNWVFNNSYTGIYKLIPTKAIFFHMVFKNVCVTVNLQTEETIIKTIWGNHFFNWHNLPGREVAIDRLELEQLK